MSSGLGRRREGPLLVLPATAVLAVFYLCPVLYNAWLSTRELKLFEAGSGSGVSVGLQQLRAVLAEPETLAMVRNTAFWLTAPTVIARLALGLGLALMVNSALVRRHRLTGIARGMAALPWAVPPVVGVVVWRFLLDQRSGVGHDLLERVGIIDAGTAIFEQVSTVWIGIDAIVVWRELPFVMLMYLAALQSIPDELFEASALDGAGRWADLRFVILPMVRPVTVVAGLMTTIWTFNNFLYVWLTTKGGPGTYTQVIATGVYSEGFTGSYDVGRAAALSVLVSVALGVFAIVYFLVVYRRSRGVV